LAEYDLVVRNGTVTAAADVCRADRHRRRPDESRNLILRGTL